MRTALLSAALLAAAGLASCARSDGPPAVAVLDPWCRPAPQAALSAACYLTLTANTDDRFTGAATDAATKTEIHTMSMDDGIMRMRPLPEGLALPRDQSVALKSGGEHLMLIGPKAALVEGGSVVLTLSFEKAPPVTVTAAVRRAAAAGAHGGH